MNDLVKRLRDEKHLMQSDGLGALLETGAQAADEIERLRGALEIYAEECHGACCIEGYRQGPGCGYAARAALSPPAKEQRS